MRKLVILLATIVAAPAFAQATDAGESAPLCTDRPTKATAVCTVPAGAVQLETDLPSWTRNDDGGVRSDVILYANPTLKLGLGANTDVQVNWAPYVSVRTRSGGVVGRTEGVGDVYVRVKQRLTNADSKLQIGIVPYVKAPTARSGIGNRKWEGGLVVPIQYSLPGGVTLTAAPEIDALADADGRGKHVQLIGALNIGKTLTSKLTAYAEVWTAQNYDPAGTVRQYLADVALAYLATPTLQFDVGGNFGLSRATPDAQIYFGVSTRF
jgi:Putative MetA-pathway of phenol degradation